MEIVHLAQQVARRRPVGAPRAPDAQCDDGPAGAHPAERSSSESPSSSGKRFRMARVDQLFDLGLGRHRQRLRQQPLRRRGCASRGTIDFTSGIWRGAIDSSRSPRPISTQVQHRSPAMSPHIATGHAGLLRRDDDLAQRAQDRRVERVVEVADVLVLAVGRQRVLDEIVGADAEEVALARRAGRRSSRAGRLDHDAQRDLASRAESPRAPAPRSPRRRAASRRAARRRPRSAGT